MAKGFKDHSKVDAKINEINTRNKPARLPTLRRKGNGLYARDTFPPRPDSDRSDWHQQDLNLGIHADSADRKEVDAKLKSIAADLLAETFDWFNYWPPHLVARAKAKLKGQQIVDIKMICDWISLLEEKIFENKKRTPTTEKTFKKFTASYLKRLPQEESLTLEVLTTEIKKTEPDSYTRYALCRACCKLAKLANLDVDVIKSLRGKYSPNSVAPRDLPSDEDIEQVYQMIPNPGWRWVFGMIAVYGLRPHEVFLLDTQKLEAGDFPIQVLEGKTGARVVYPSRRDWIEKFNLRQVCLPNVTIQGNTYDELGHKVSHQFWRYELPFPAYHLRHCYAIRWIKNSKIKESMIAKWMGHSVSIHTEVYQRHLSEREGDEVFNQYTLEQDLFSGSTQVELLCKIEKKVRDAAIPEAIKEELVQGIRTLMRSTSHPIQESSVQSEGKIAVAIDSISNPVHQLLHTDEAKQIAGSQVFNKIDINIKKQSPQAESPEESLQRRLSDEAAYIQDWCNEGLRRLDRGEPVLLNLRPKHSGVHYSFNRAEILGILGQVTKNSDRLSGNSTGNEGWCVLSGMVLAARRNLQRMAQSNP